jgi:hypothetical protein
LELYGAGGSLPDLKCGHFDSSMCCWPSFWLLPCSIPGCSPLYFVSFPYNFLHMKLPVTNLKELYFMQSLSCRAVSFISWLGWQLKSWWTKIMGYFAAVGQLSSTKQSIPLSSALMIQGFFAPLFLESMHWLLLVLVRLLCPSVTAARQFPCSEKHFNVWIPGYVHWSSSCVLQNLEAL